MVTLQTQWGMISTTEHREQDLKTKIGIYLGLPTRLRESENNNYLVQELAMNTENYVDSTIHSTI